MGDYCYCEKCREPMRRPTLAQALSQTHRCECGERRHVDEHTVSFLVDDQLVEPLTKLAETVEKLSASVVKLLEIRAAELKRRRQAKLESGL